MTNTTHTSSKQTTIVADICLYGNPHTCGAEYLGARLPHGQTFGTGEPLADRTFSEAIWAGQRDLYNAGVRRGLVRVFDAGGERLAIIGVAEAVAYGQLQWQPAPVYTISAEALIAAAV